MADRLDVYEVIAKLAEKKGYVDFLDGEFCDADGGEQLIVADWHDPRTKEFASYLAKNSINMHFYDEVTTCSECGKYVCTQPTSYSWIPNYIIINGSLYCRDCVEQNLDFVVEKIIEEFKNSSSHAVYAWCLPLLNRRGWLTRLGDNYETGWHPGQTDDPVEILTKVFDLGYDVIFYIDRVGQFDTYWNILIKKREDEEHAL